MLHFFLLFGFTINLISFLPKGLTSDWLYITRVTVVFSWSLVRSPHIDFSPFYQHWCSQLFHYPAATFLLPHWQKGWQRLGWGYHRPAEATKLSCFSNSITGTNYSSSDSLQRENIFLWLLACQQTAKWLGFPPFVSVAFPCRTGRVVLHTTCWQGSFDLRTYLQDWLVLLLKRNRFSSYK